MRKSTLSMRKPQMRTSACALAETHCRFLLFTAPKLLNTIIEPRHEKTCFCICANKDADQMCDIRAADQRLCFRYLDSTIPLLPKSEIFKPLYSHLLKMYSPVCVGPGRKPRRQVFSRRGSYVTYFKSV